jgi:EmrB/QacA subfamily drug resistance transporter
MSTRVVTPTPATRRSTAAAPARWMGFGVVLVVAVMNLLDSTITQTAAPAIRHQLDGSYADLEWLTAAYTLAMSVTLLLGGRLGDVFGRRRVLLAGIVGFVAASTLCAIAPSIATLIAARVLQGVTAAAMLPQTFGLIREMFGDAGQQKAFAVFGPVMGLGMICGPIVGGALVDADIAGIGWRAIFLVNVPLGLAAFAVGRVYLPRNPAATPDHRFDTVSVVLAVAAGFCLIFPLIQGRQDGWPAWSFAMLVAGAGLIAAFGVHQSRRLRRGAAPLVDPAILTRRPYVAGLVVVVGFFGAMGGMVLSLNVMFQTGLGFSPLACGVATMAIAVAAAPGSIVSSILLPRLGRTTIHIGAALMATGLAATIAVLASCGSGLSAWDCTGPLAIAGFGMGLVFVPMADVILAGVAPHEIGSASGLLEAVQQMASSLGIALAGTVLFGQLGSALGRGAFVSATAVALGASVGLLALAWLAVWWLPRHARAAG